MNEEYIKAYRCINSSIDELEEAKDILKQLAKDSSTKTKKDYIDELLELDNINSIDSAVPQGWADEVAEKTGVYPAPFTVWVYYEDGCSGPLALTETGKVVLEIFNFITFGHLALEEENKVWSAEEMIRRC